MATFYLLLFTQLNNHVVCWQYNFCAIFQSHFMIPSLIRIKRICVSQQAEKVIHNESVYYMIRYLKTFLGSMLSASFRPGSLRSTWLNVHPSTGNWSHTQWILGRNYLCISKYKLLHSCSLELDELFHPTLLKSGIIHYSMPGFN